MQKWPATEFSETRPRRLKARPLFYNSVRCTLVTGIRLVRFFLCGLVLGLRCSRLRWQRLFRELPGVECSVMRREVLPATRLSDCALHRASTTIRPEPRPAVSLYFLDL